MLPERFEKYIAQNKLCTKRERLLVAVSGGVDSMVMLSLLASCGYDFAVAHCNFQLRGSESEADEQLVREEAQRLGLKLHVERFDTRGQIERSGDSLQMVARDLRYRWFEELCNQNGYSKIVIAHHGDDSTETFFINLTRGTGLRGLTGIGTKNGNIIRPLMFATRDEIEAYAAENGVKYRVDLSNLSADYLRNKIRLQIVPRFREVSPKFTQTMSQNIERLSDTIAFVDRNIERIRAEVTASEGSSTIIHFGRIDRAMPLRFVIYELLRGFGFGGEVCDEICRAIENEQVASRSTELRASKSSKPSTIAGKQFLAEKSASCGERMVAYIDRARLIILPATQVEKIYTELKVGIEVSQFQFIGRSFKVESLDIEQLESLKVPANVALFDADKITYPLLIRPWQLGDSFVPFGMEGRKKVSDLLVDSKVAITDKMKQAIIFSEGEIIWVVGRRTDGRFAVDGQTKRVLRIEVDF